MTEGKNIHASRHRTEGWRRGRCSTSACSPNEEEHRAPCAMPPGGGAGIRETVDPRRPRLIGIAARPTASPWARPNWKTAPDCADLGFLSRTVQGDRVGHHLDPPDWQSTCSGRGRAWKRCSRATRTMTRACAGNRSAIRRSHGPRGTTRPTAPSAATGPNCSRDGQGVLTHCNAGGLATADYGTALAVFFAAAEAGKTLHVFADETRPLLQGARLTAWELQQRGIDVTLICDSMAAQVMREGPVQAVIIGADRIAANGDTANKIGTYGVAVLAAAHDIPFYVAAPRSTFDLSIASGDGDSHRAARPARSTHGFGRQTAPDGSRRLQPRLRRHARRTDRRHHHRERGCARNTGSPSPPCAGSGKNSLQLLQAAGDLNAAHADGRAGGASGATGQPAASRDLIQRPAHLGEIAVVGGIHVGPEQLRHIDSLRAAAGAAAALAAGMAEGQLHPRVGEEFGLVGGEFQAGGHRPVGLELLEGGIAGDGGGDRLQAQRPLEQGRLPDIARGNRRRSPLPVTAGTGFSWPPGRCRRRRLSSWRPGAPCRRPWNN